MLFKKVLLFLALCVSFATFSFAASAPDFTLQDLNGQKVSLSDFKGKVVFVDFWASWCPPCRQSIPAVEKLYEEYKDNGNIVFLGINLNEDKSSVSKFVEKQKIKYTVLMSDKKVISNYKISGIPAFFLIDQKGNMYNKYVGYSPDSENSWKEDIKKLIK
ncbi:MAG: TlpA disulfide reductase family protein [Endomicrobiaceae bacterium]|nr:TlpA disulfide reductase family protein [Endomicrobiaceae bacterium]